MKKLVVAVVLVGALVWAKKRFMDAPAAPVRSEAEAAAEKFGGAIAKAKTAQAAANDAHGLSGMLGSLLHRDAGTPEAKAKKRLETFMAAWKEGGTSLNDSAQAAACLWSRGVRFIADKEEIQDAANGFDRWRQQRDLYVEIKSYAVGEVVARDRNEGRGDYTVVEVLINERPLRIGVPDTANPLFWAP